MEYDISGILEQWRHKPGDVTVRRIEGKDGRPKIQMRLDLGLLQMDMEGRPDGRQPHGCESLLAYHQGRLARYKQANGVEVGFELSAKQCRGLREEAVMYYYRYLSLFILGKYEQVTRDTNRNLEAFDLCRKFGSRKADRLALEQYRPYVLMMNTRSRVQLAVDNDNLCEALDICQGGIENIEEFFEYMGKPDLAEHCSELSILNSVEEDILHKMPLDPKADLHADLNKALEQEHYEKAAELRDKLHSLNKSNFQIPPKQSEN